MSGESKEQELNMSTPLAERTVSESLPAAPVVRQPSTAYVKSKRLSEVRNSELGNQGKGPLDFEYKTAEDEDAVGDIDFKATTTTTPYKKLKKIGKKTTCMAFCLLFFGIGMIVTSFAVINQRQGSSNAFYLFLIIGIFAIIPGSYATYHVVGKFMGW